MAHDLPPVRFASDPTAPSGLRSLVEQARGNVPDAATLERFVARLDASIAANVQPPEIDLSHLHATTAATSSTVSILLKVVGTMALAGAIAGTAYVVRSPSKTAPVTQSAAATSALIVAETATPPAVQPSALAVQRSAADTPAEPSVPRPRAAVAHRSMVSEASLLDSARSLLSRDPQRALQLTREHATRFPRGSLIQEREVIAIEALRRLGKEEAARKRGAEFGQSFPDSAHQPKIDQTLER